MGILGKEDWRVDGSVNRDSVGIVLTAYRSLLSPIAYVSVPITTGLQYYGVLMAHGVKSLDELMLVDKDALFRDIIKPNIDEGILFAQDVQKRTSLPVVAPAVFEAKKQRWGQNDYMFLWLQVIEEKAAQMYMRDGWEYSNGGCEEFVQAMMMQLGFVDRLNDCDAKEEQRIRNIKVFDAKGRTLRFAEGFEQVYNAIVDLDAKGFRSGVLCESLYKLAQISAFLHDYLTDRHEYAYHCAYQIDDVWLKFETLRGLCEAAGMPYKKWVHEKFGGVVSGTREQKV